MSLRAERSECLVVLNRFHVSSVHLSVSESLTLSGSSLFVHFVYLARSSHVHIGWVERVRMGNKALVFGSGTYDME